MLRLKTSDNQIIEVEQYIMRKSTMIKDILSNNDGQIPDIIPLDTIHSSVLRAVIQYYDFYKDRPEEEETEEAGGVDFDPVNPRLSPFETRFLNEHQNIFFDMVRQIEQLGLVALSWTLTKNFGVLFRNGGSPELYEYMRQSMFPDVDEAPNERGNSGRHGNGRRRRDAR